jgi:hypothetical protein
MPVFPSPPAFSIFKEIWRKVLSDSAVWSVERLALQQKIGFCSKWTLGSVQYAESQRMHFADVKKRDKTTRPIGLWDVDAPTFLDSRFTDGGEVVSLTRRPFFTLQGLISVSGWVYLRAIVRLEELGELKNPITSSGIEPATFRFVA